MGSASISLRISSGRSNDVDRVALVLLGFSVALTAFLLFPPFLRDQVGSVPGFTGQEAADLFTPLLAMPLLALAIEYTGSAGLKPRVVFVLLVGAWVAGQGIHLAANAIGDVFPAGPTRDAFYATDAGSLDRFLDEDLSHWLWHIAWVGLLVVLLWVGTAGPEEGARPMRSSVAVAALAGVFHGFTWAVVTDQGGTWPLAIPATAGLLGLALVLRRGGGPGRVIRTFVVVGCVVTLALYAVWILVAGWPPAPPCDRITCS